MRHLLLILLFSGFLTIGDESQNLMITYDVRFQKYESKPDSFKSAEALLYITDKGSFYIDRAKLIRMKLESSMRGSSLSGEEKMQKFLSTESEKFDYFIRKDIDSRTLSYSDEINGVHFTYEEDFPEINWEITTDTTRILNYLCQRATGSFAGRSYEAWFSNDIPVSEGPYKFTGLPGLIMKLSDTEKQFTFIIKGVEVRENFKLPPRRTKNVVTRESFQNRMDDYYMNGAKYNTYGPDTKFVIDGKSATVADAYEELKMEYLDRVRIEKE